MVAVAQPMRGAGTEAHQGETLLDLMLSASNGSSSKDDNGSTLDGSKEGGPSHIQFRRFGQEQVVPFGGVTAPIAMPSSSCCCM